MRARPARTFSVCRLVFLYGMRVYAVLASVMASGLVIALYIQHAPFSLGGWIGGTIEIAFGAAGLALSVLVRRSTAPA